MLFIFKLLHSQDTLPEFTLLERGNKVIISWINPFPNCVQLNVQRSFDSLRFFTTVFTSVSPQLPQNGYSENKLPTNRIFYRIFYVLEGGSYFFSKSRRIGSENSSALSGRIFTNPTETQKIVKVRIKDTVFRVLLPGTVRMFRDSILQKTRDTLFAVNDSTFILKPYVGKEFFRPSPYVFSIPDGVSISLPGAASHKFSIRFFEENGSPLFDIKHVKDAQLLLDKSNFLHAGWFLFELYEDDKLKEKNKFYLSKAF